MRLVPLTCVLLLAHGANAWGGDPLRVPWMVPPPVSLRQRKSEFRAVDTPECRAKSTHAWLYPPRDTYHYLPRYDYRAAHYYPWTQQHRWPPVHLQMHQPGEVHEIQEIHKPSFGAYGSAPRARKTRPARLATR